MPRVVEDSPIRQRRELKPIEIEKVGSVPRESRRGIDIEVVSISRIPDGVEVLARAWNAQGQIGFGKDGSVEIERFRIFNPPVLVPDPAGDIVRNDPVGPDLDIPHEVRLREDPREALLQVIEKTISLKKEKFGPANIVRGKIGSTTLTAYPAAGNNAPTDNGLKNDGVNVTWTTLVNEASADSERNSTTGICLGRAHTTTDRYQRIDRSITGFTTSSIGTDVISSAVLSLYCPDHTSAAWLDQSLGAFEVDIVSAAPANEANIAVGDYDSLGTTVYASIASGSIVTGYNDFTLNAAGITYINESGNTFFGERVNHDTDDNVAGWTWVSNALSYLSWYDSDQTGTSTDPMLVVEHAPAVTTAIKDIIGGGYIMFPR